MFYTGVKFSSNFHYDINCPIPTVILDFAGDKSIVIQIMSGIIGISQNTSYAP